MTYRSCLMLILLLFLLPHAGAADDAEWRAFEKSFDHNPLQVLKEAEFELQRSQLRGDKRDELKAIRELSYGWGSMTTTSPLPKKIERGIALAQELHDSESLGHLYAIQSVIVASAGHSARADTLIQQAIAIAERDNLTRLHGHILIWRAYSVDEARASDKTAAATRAYKLLETVGDKRGMAIAMTFMSNVHLSQSELLRPKDGESQAQQEAMKKAVEYGMRVLELIDPAIHRHTAFRAHFFIGRAYASVNDHSRARVHFEKALGYATDMQYLSRMAHIEVQLAAILTRERRHADALEHIDAALRLVRQADATEGYIAFNVVILRASLLAHLGRKQESLEALAEAQAKLPSMEKGGALKIVLSYYRRAADTYRLLGDYRQAYEYMIALRNRERRATAASTKRAAAELTIRFDAQLKETENALLRSQQKQAEIKRVALMLALALSLTLLGAVWFYLHRRATVARLEAAHHRALAAAEAAANEAKRTFLANMSHELRSPLNAVLGFTELMLRRPNLPVDALQDLAIVHNSGQHLYTLINQVLDLSKIEAGRLILNETDFDLYALLDELGEMFTVPATRKGLHLIVENDPNVPKYLHADALKLRQVLINLLNNAIKFTSEGSVALNVSVSGEQDPVLSIAVSDTGPGVAPGELDKLGSVFEQAQAGRMAKEGTGLGLAISASFVQLMGSSLRFSSQPGVGMTIAFDLPTTVFDAATAVAASEKPRVVGLVTGQPQYRILVADDRAESRQLLVRLLSPLGFDVRGADNGEAALAVWDEWSPHLILMDMRMPVTDGREAARRIKATSKGQDTIIIALTASSFDDEREQVLVDGCDDFLGKPFRESELFDMMHKHLSVRFTYHRTDQVENGPASTGLLPAELREQLQQALKELNVEHVESAIEQIRSHDEPLAIMLTEMAYRYEYDRMRELVASKVTAFG